MELRILGPVQLWSDDRSIPLRLRQQRLVLAVLALEANRLAGVERLVDLLWDQKPPKSARTMVHTHVSPVQSAPASLSAKDGGVRLLRERPAYSLHCEPPTVDAHRFQSLDAMAATVADDERTDHRENLRRLPARRGAFVAPAPRCAND